jgi:low affinity Fe/Cu permease
VSERFARFAEAVGRAASSPQSFSAAFLLVLAWLVSGFFFGWESELWHLLLNSPTTSITFLMVFLIQNTQNRNMKALHVKLDELIRSTAAARNELISAEEMDQETLDTVRAELRREGN